MNDEEWTLIRADGNREIYHVRKAYPDGNGYAEFYRGKEYVTIGGTQKQTPSAPNFKTEGEAVAWVTAGK